MSIPARRLLAAAAVVALAVAGAPGVAHADPPTTTLTYTGDFAGVFPNPERGFHNRYEIVNDPSVNDYASNTIPGFNPDMLDRTFARAKTDGDTLIHSYVHLDKYQTSDLPPALLDNLSSGLAAIRAQGLKIVLRFAYVWDGYSAVTEPQMERHIDQLAPVLAANSDVIMHLEAGFFGAWGEWHDSPYTAASEQSQAPVRYELVKKLLSSTPATIPVAIRYPIFNYEFAQRTTPPPGCTLPDNCRLTTQDEDRLGFHDDCFLADSADMGTYDQNSWLGWFDVPTKKQWVYDMTTSTGGNKIVGGETCDSTGGDDAAGVNAQYELAHQHWTEINEDYAPVNLNLWKQANLAAAGTDPAETLFTRARRKLGYRLRLVDATYTTQATAGSAFTFAAHLANDGYAGIIKPRPVFLVFDDGTHRYDVPLPGLDPRTWRPGAVSVPAQTVTLPAMVPGSYKLALWLPDPAGGLRGNPAYSVRLADTGTWDAAKGYNVLAGAVSVSSCRADCTPPSAPALSTTGATASSVALTWSGATDNVGVTGYRVSRDGTVVATVTATAYTDTAVPTGSHTYTVTARDAAGNESPPSNAVTVGVECTDCTPPSAPTGLTATATTSRSITLSWHAATDNVGVAGYRISRGGTQVATTTGTTFTDTGLTPATAYSYSVRAYDAAGNVSPAATVAAGTAGDGLVVDDFNGTPAYPAAALNDLGKWTGGNCFGNGGGSGVVAGDALTLQYNNCGWFGSDVDVDVSQYTYLVVRIKGASGGEQNQFSLSLGGATKVFGDYTLDGGGHPALTSTYQDIKIPMAANGISRTSPAQLALGFWYGAAGGVTIDSISFTL
jgi:chitodextrinase